ncbi:uncharacterized protein LOC144318365 [Canis aureus]
MDHAGFPGNSQDQKHSRHSLTQRSSKAALLPAKKEDFFPFGSSLKTIPRMTCVASTEVPYSISKQTPSQEDSEDTVRRWPSASQEEKSLQNLTMAGTLTSAFQSPEILRKVSMVSLDAIF